MDFETYYKQLQGSSEPTTSNKYDDSFKNYYDQLRMDSGVIPDPKKIPLNDTQQNALNVEQSDMNQMDQARQIGSQISQGEHQQQQLNQDLIDQQQMVQANKVNETRPSLEEMQFPTDYPGGIINPVNNINRFMKTDVGNILRNFQRGAGEAMVLSGSQLPASHTTGSELGDQAANFVGAGAGYLTNPAALEQGVVGLGYNNKLTQNLVTRAGNLFENNLASRVAQGVAREGTAGAIMGGVGTLNSGRGDAESLAYGVGGGALIGGGLGAAAPILGKAVNAASEAAGRDLTSAADKPTFGTAVQDFIQRVKSSDVPVRPTSDAITSNVSRVTNTAAQQAEDAFKRIESPTKGRIEPKNTYYADRLDELFTAAKQEQLPPGREREALDDLWSRMAGPNDPNLDQLIELGTPTLKQLERKTPTADMLSRARTQQAQKEVVGVSLPVKSELDRGLRFSNTPQSELITSPKRSTFNDSQLLGRDKPSLREPLNLKSEPITDPNLTGKPMAEISQPNNPDTILSRLSDATKGDQNLGFNAFGKRAGMYDNLSTDTRSQLVSKTAREPINLRDTADAGYRKIVDDMYRFKDYDKLAEKVTGRKLAPSEQSHTLALNSRGSDMIADHILNHDLVDINGNVIGRSLKNATQQIPKKDIVAFEDYQVLKHGMYRMSRGEKVYKDSLEMTPDKAAQKVAQYEQTHPEFKKIANEMYQFRENLAKSWLVDTGLLDRKSWDGLLENNPFYVANNRQFSNVERGGGGAKKGFGGQSSPLKPAPGSQRKIISPIESDIEHVDQYVKAGKRNQVMQNIVKMAQKDPEAFEGFIEIMPMTDNMKHSDLKKINEILAADGVDGLISNINEAFDQMFNQAKTAGKKDLNNVIAVRFNGEPVYVKVNDAPLLEAITSMTPQAQGVILEAARNTTRIMKLLTTGVNPVFSLTRNLIRDIPMAYVASKTTNNLLRFSYDLLDSVVSILGNKDMYKSFKSLGGGHSSSIAADRNLLAQSKREILPQSNLKTLPARIIGSVENFTNALETAPRLGEFKRLTKQGKNSNDSKIAGLFAANDVTVNFKRRGNVGREIDAFVPYFNAAIQGLDKTVRTFKDQPAAATMKAIAAITVPSVFLYAMNHNDPDYQKLDDRTKDLYYLFPNGDGTFTKLPKPREGGVIFGSGVERALRKWKDDDPKAFRDFAENARVAFSPPVISGLTKPGSFTDKLEGGLVGDSILGPLADLKSNKDFAGRPIVPKYMEGLSPELQYDERTSKLSQWIGSKINQSPKQLDYLIKSYSGIIGQFGVPLNSEGGSILKALKQQVTADPTYSNSVFTDFYDTKDKLDTAEKDYQQTGKESPDYNRSDQLFLGRVSRQISKVRTTMQEVQNDNSLSREKKDNKLKELQVLVTSIAEDANNELKPKAAK